MELQMICTKFHIFSFFFFLGHNIWNKNRNCMTNNKITIIPPIQLLCIIPCTTTIPTEKKALTMLAHKSFGIFTSFWKTTSFQPRILMFIIRFAAKNTSKYIVSFNSHLYFLSQYQITMIYFSRLLSFVSLLQFTGVTFLSLLTVTFCVFNSHLQRVMVLL